MGDSLLKWLGFDKPPQQRVRHKVWRKQLSDTSTARQLKLGEWGLMGRGRGLTWSTEVTSVVAATGSEQRMTELVHG